jgi:hypothetical protein
MVQVKEGGILSGNVLCIVHQSICDKVLYLVEGFASASGGMT